MLFFRFILLAALASSGVPLTAQNTSSFLAPGNLDVDRVPRVFYPFTVPKAGYTFVDTYEIAATADGITLLEVANKSLERAIGMPKTTHLVEFADRSDGEVEMRAFVQDYILSGKSPWGNFSTCMANASAGGAWESDLRDVITEPIIKIANVDGTLKELQFNEELNLLSDWLMNEFPAPSQQRVARSFIQPIQCMLNSTWYSIIKDNALKPGDTEVVAQEHPFGVIHKAVTLRGYSLYEKVDCAVFSVEGSYTYDVGTAFQALFYEHLQKQYLAGSLKNSTDMLIYKMILLDSVHIQDSGTMYFDYVNEVVLSAKINFTASFELFGDTHTQAFHFYTSQTSEILEYPSFINASDAVNFDSAPKLRFRPQIRRVG